MIFHRYVQFPKGNVDKQFFEYKAFPNMRKISLMVIYGNWN